MIKINANITGEKDLEEYINFVQKMLSMKVDKNFQKFIQQKCLETVRSVSERLISGTTNDEYKEEYIARHKIQEEPDGFILYNDLVIPAILTTKNTINQNRDNGIVRNYDEGFALALAFEYGTGIVGEFNPIEGAWEYNVNKYNELGWYYKKQNGESERTTGYQGFQIYGTTAKEIKENLNNWVYEYLNKKEV